MVLEIATLIFLNQGGKAAVLPDMHLVGDIVNHVKLEDKLINSFSVREIEFGIGGYLHPKIRAEAVICAHSHTLGTIDTEAHGGHNHTHSHESEHEHSGYLSVEEAFVDFLQIWGPFEAKLGRKFTEFGSFNPLHPEEWPYVDIPLVLQKSFGSESLRGDGGSLSALFAFPSGVLKLTGGVWRKYFGPFEDAFFSSRLVTAFSVGDSSDIKFGFSYVGGVIEDDNLREFSSYLGSDISYKLREPNISIVIEPIVRLSKTFEFIGLYAASFYSNFGIRFDLLGDETMRVNPIIVFPITENSRFRLQYGLNVKEAHGHNSYDGNHNAKRISHHLFLQFIFLIGVHTHGIYL